MKPADPAAFGALYRLLGVNEELPALDAEDGWTAGWFLGGDRGLGGAAAKSAPLAKSCYFTASFTRSSTSA